MTTGQLIKDPSGNGRVWFVRRGYKCNVTDSGLLSMVWSRDEVNTMSKKKFDTLILGKPIGFVKSKSIIRRIKSVFKNKMEGSGKYKLDKKDGVKIAKGAGIALGGALIAYLLAILPQIDLGTSTPIVVAIASILLNAARKWIKSNSIEIKDSDIS